MPRGVQSTPQGIPLQTPSPGACALRLGESSQHPKAYPCKTPHPDRVRAIIMARNLGDGVTDMLLAEPRCSWLKRAVGARSARSRLACWPRLIDIFITCHSDKTCSWYWGPPSAAVAAAKHHDAKQPPSVSLIVRV